MVSFIFTALHMRHIQHFNFNEEQTFWIETALMCCRTVFHSLSYISVYLYLFVEFYLKVICDSGIKVRYGLKAIINRARLCGVQCKTPYKAGVLHCICKIN